MLDVEFCMDSVSLIGPPENHIVFAVDITLLHSMLAVHTLSLAARDAPATIQVSLVNKLSVRSRSAVPFLTFETKAPSAAVVQDVPIVGCHAPM
jgi:hypothetical protein